MRYKGTLVLLAVVMILVGCEQDESVGQREILKDITLRESAEHLSQNEADGGIWAKYFYDPVGIREILEGKRPLDVEYLGEPVQHLEEEGFVQRRANCPGAANFTIDPASLFATNQKCPYSDKASRDPQESPVGFWDGSITVDGRDCTLRLAVGYRSQLALSEVPLEWSDEVMMRAAIAECEGELP